MKPLILVTNDDGVMAPGIRAVAESLRELGHDEGPVAVPPAAAPEVSLETLRKIKQGLSDLIRLCAE